MIEIAWMLLAATCTGIYIYIHTVEVDAPSDMFLVDPEALNMCTFEDINDNSSIEGTNFNEEKKIKCPSKKKKE